MRTEADISVRERTRQVKERALALGFDLVGVASPAYGAHADHLRRWLDMGRHGEMTYMARNVQRRSALDVVLPGVRSVISLGLNYGADAPTGLSGRTCPEAGLVSKYALGEDYHRICEDKLAALGAFLGELDPTARWRAYVDYGPVLERALAQAAGLGWIGKHTCLISRSIGSWFFLCELLTTLELAQDQPHSSHCGTCRRCIDVCPTGAIVAPYELDARLCISYLTIELKGPIPVELRPAIGNRIFGCDDCQDVCPWNRFARLASEARLRPEPDRLRPALAEWLQLTPEQFRRRFRNTPFERLKRRGLLRNVCVAMGNSGDSAMAPPLVAALCDDEPLVRGHAAWALGRLGYRGARQILLRQSTVEPDAWVREEIRQALSALDQVTAHDEPMKGSSDED